jgi:3-phosphoshikimate 1-carboxyvinyltransferase
MGADRLTSLDEQGGEPVGDLTVATALHGVRLVATRPMRMIDEFPIFAVAAAHAHGEPVCDAEARQESDRISALGQELRLLGINFTETPDGFVIQGGQSPLGGRVQSHGDHRLAMSLAVSGLAARQPVQVEGAEMIHESFPDFVAVLRTLGASVSTTVLPA